MSEVLPKEYFEKTTPRHRGLESLEGIVANFNSRSWLVYPLDEDQLPIVSEIPGLKHGLESFLRLASTQEKFTIFDAGAGEGSLSSDIKQVKLSNVAVISADYYPTEKVENLVGVDLNAPLPIVSQGVDMTICSFVLPYLEDPLKTINEFFRITKKGGYIIVNGVKSMLSEEGKFLLSSNIKADGRITVWSRDRFCDSDWAIIRVDDPEFQLPYELDESKSQTVKIHGNQPVMVPSFSGAGPVVYGKRDIRDLANFIYKIIK